MADRRLPTLLCGQRVGTVPVEKIETPATITRRLEDDHRVKLCTGCRTARDHARTLAELAAVRDRARQAVLRG